MSTWQVIHGDCLEVLKTLPAGSVDAVITDPPYGINWSGPRTRRETVIGDDRPFDPSSIIEMGLPTLMWGANNFASRLPDSQNWAIWLKRAVDKGCRSKDHGDCEIAWTRGLFKGGVRLLRFIWDGNIREKDYEMDRLHPAQKPVEVMKWCLSFLPEGCTVLDPFCGSGSTGVACVQTARSFIGIEIDERYCEIARRRIAEAANHLYAEVAAK